MQNMQQDDSDSCLVNRMRYYLDISPAEEALLRELEKDEISYKARSQLSFTQAPNHLFVVKSGWLYSYIDLDEKHRQVLRIHYPGDIVGLTDIAIQEPFGEMMTVTNVDLCPFPKNRLDRIFTESPRLTALIFSLGMLDQVVLLDRIKMMGRASALNTVAHFLLEIHARLKIHSPEDVSAEFEMPLTQDVIGDAIGLTNVSVSNVMTQLQFDGFLAFNRKMIRFHDEEKLKQQIDFKDRYFKIDTSWFPTPKT
jgi:CRP-like cAMP-binding protein